MKIRIGNPVRGENFFGRDKELSYAWSLIEDGNNLNLPSPRRVGKTSFALKMLDYAKEKEWNTVHINLEAHTESGFVEEFIRQLNEQSNEKMKKAGASILEFINGMKPTVSVPGVSFSINWQNQQKDIYQKVSKLLDHTQPTLIFFDEVTVLMNKFLNEENGKQKVSAFLHWLREIRITPDSNIQWVYCSSVGIENFAHTHGLSNTFNDLFKYELKSFDRATSLAMLDKLATNYKLDLDNPIKEDIVIRLHYCLPFFLQLIFEKIRQLHQNEDKPIDVDIVHIAYERLTDESHFNTWIERINEQYGSLAEFAFVFLKHACQQKEGVKKASFQNLVAERIQDPEKAEDLTNQVLYKLVNDGYFIKEVDSYQFRSPLLRDFWFKRFVQ